MNNHALNGSDQLMRGFDFELRRRGFAGNHCQIALGLAANISPEILKRRLAALQKEFPMMNARVGGLFRPRWKMPSATDQSVLVQVHSDVPGLRQKLFNQPLRQRRRELMRFDLVERSGSRMASSILKRRTRRARKGCVAWACGDG